MSLDTWARKQHDFDEVRMENAIEITLRVRYGLAIGAFSKIATFDSPRMYLVRYIQAASEALAHFEELNSWLWVDVPFDETGFAIAHVLEKGQAADVTKLVQEKLVEFREKSKQDPEVPSSSAKARRTRGVQRRTRRR